MNNQAVTFIQTGEFQRGVELYQSAIKSLPQEESDLLGVVYYNLALAFLRNEELESGLSHLQTSTSFPDSRVHKKACSLHKRIEESQASGRKLKFASNIPSTLERDKANLFGFNDTLITQRTLSIGLINVYRRNRHDRSDEHVVDGETPTDSTLPPLSGKKEAS
jgi:hypothetical protein